jgi:hypothetical protein
MLKLKVKILEHEPVRGSAAALKIRNDLFPYRYPDSQLIPDPDPAPRPT